QREEVEEALAIRVERAVVEHQRYVAGARWQPPCGLARIVLVASVERIEHVVEPDIPPVDVLRREAQAMVVEPERGQRLAGVAAGAMARVGEPGASVQEQVVLERAGLDRVER